jgi:hypothetical protein
LVGLDAVFEVGHGGLEGLDGGEAFLDLLILELHLVLDLCVAIDLALQF